jgi:surfactin synthase thioesterase subunit
MGKANKKNVEVSTSKESKINYMDLNDEKKAQILSQEFMKFNQSMGQMLGMNVGVRLSSTETAIQAVLVPVKLPPAKQINPSSTETDETSQPKV